MKKYLIIGAMAALAIVGCSKEPSSTENNRIFDQDGNSYLRVALYPSTAGNATRADEGDPAFQDGTAQEGLAHTATFLFYKEGSYITSSSLSESELDLEVSDEASSVENETKNIVTVKGLTSSNMPDALLVLINANPTLIAKFENGLSLSDAKNELMKVTASDTTAYGYREGANFYFTMSNSTYKDGSSIVKEVAVTDTNFYESAAAAQTATPVEVYVDRVASRVDVTFSSTSGEITTPGYGETVTMAVSLNGWSINAFNKSSYAVKDFDASWDYDWALKTGSGWANALNHRSSWAKDPNYTDDADNYPETAYLGQLNGNIASSPLGYYSYNGIIDNSSAGDGTDKYSNLALQQRYAFENTFDGGLLAARRAWTHVIVAAKTQFNGADEDYFNYKGKFMLLDDYKLSVLYEIRQKLINENKYLAVEDASSTIGYKPISEMTEDELKATAFFTDMTVRKAHYSDQDANTGATEQDDTVNSDGMVGLFYAEGTQFKVISRTDSGDAWEVDGTTGKAIAADITCTDVTTLQTLANGYKGGQNYYVIPIEHLANSTVDQTNIVVGDYGIVRNHLYMIQVDGIANPGKGVWDADELIIPGDKEKYYYLNASIKINAWHIVKQHTTL
jgi:hypothetical protein